MKVMTPQLVDPSVKREDRIRLMLLYILSQNGVFAFIMFIFNRVCFLGVSSDTLTALKNHTSLSDDDMRTIENAALLGLNIMTDVRLL